MNRISHLSLHVSMYWVFFSNTLLSSFMCMKGILLPFERNWFTILAKKSQKSINQTLLLDILIEIKLEPVIPYHVDLALLEPDLHSYIPGCTLRALRILSLL